MAEQSIIVDEYAPARTAVQGSVALSSTAANIGLTITAQSDTGWELWCASAWILGDASGQIRTVAANEAWLVPSRSLLGWWAKVASGTPTLVATGARKASP